MPTLVTVPATTGPKSQETGPDVLLMELAVWAEQICAKLKTRTTAIRPSNGLEVVLAVNLTLFFDLRSGVGVKEAGSVDMVSPEE
jgi:hypothetical protein